jgi:hypothetical protein
VKWACNSALVIFSGSTSSFVVAVMISIEASTYVYTYELLNMVESRKIRQAVCKALTSSYQTGGRRYATSKDQRLPKLHKAITNCRYKARAEICGAVERLIW